MELSKIVVADSVDASRTMILEILTKKGYMAYPAKDAASAIRLSRSIMPSLVIIDVGLRGSNAFDTGKILEDDNISTALFITGNPDMLFMERISKMNLYAYIGKPIIPAQLLQLVEFSIMTSNRMKDLNDKIHKLENTLESRKKIEKAKGILVERMKISEDEAYKRMRKKSMDDCVPMEILAEKIITKAGTPK